MENALVILCGGDSSRMGSDKALLPLATAAWLNTLFINLSHISQKYIYP